MSYLIRVADFLIALGGTLLVAKLFEIFSPEHFVDQIVEVTDNLAPTIRHYNTLGVARSFGESALNMKTYIQQWLADEMGPAATLVESVSYLFMVLIGAVPLTIVSLAEQARGVMDWVAWSVFSGTVLVSWSWAFLQYWFFRNYGRFRKVGFWRAFMVISLGSVFVSSIIFAALQWTAYLSLVAFGRFVRLSEAAGIGGLIIWGFQEYTKRSATEGLIEGLLHLRKTIMREQTASPCSAENPTEPDTQSDGEDVDEQQVAASSWIAFPDAASRSPDDSGKGEH